MYKKYQVYKWIAIILAVILVLGICGSVISLVKHKDKKVDADDYIIDVVATFEFGENKTQEDVDENDVGVDGEENKTLHSDGIAVTDSLEFVDGDYKLVLKDLSKVYSKAFDAVGNSCLKLGSATAPASFKFTVPSNVTSVVFYVAGYKDKLAKISLNLGNIKDVLTLSNEGEYTAIQIAVPSNRVITFCTATGGTRAMIDRIEFIGKVKE